MDSKKIKNLKRVVEELLARWPATRNSDIDLTLSLWHQYYNEDLRQIDGRWFVSFEALQYLPQQDHIGRVRRKLQESGKYPPTDPQIAKERGWQEEEWRKSMGSNPELRKII